MARLFNVDKRLCQQPEQGWQQVARNVPIEQLLQLLEDGLDKPEISPHVYRSYQINDNPGP